MDCEKENHLSLRVEEYSVKLQVNTMQNILSSFLLTKILILHHLLSSQTNIRKVFLSLTFYTAIKLSHS